MNVETKPVLALAIGILILLVPATIQPARHFSTLFLGKLGKGEEVKSKDLRVQGDARSKSGLYGFQYRGF
jgi:hypothetical protein